MKVKAYAKINLTLDITGRREHGYHLLDTVMQSVSLFDELELERGKEPGIRLRCDREYLPLDTKNTAFRAARYFFEYCGLQKEGLTVSIQKHIPSRAGMGGGSADGAAVLLALNEIYGAKLSLEALMGLGAKVGADVPFCIHGGTCRCTGVGELVQPAPELPDCFLVICKPPAGMSTPRAYALVDKYPLSRSQATPKLLAALESGDLRQIGESLGNRFDETMKLMQVRDIKKAMLSCGVLGAMMTGSGSAVYGIFETEEKARNCMQVLGGKGELFLARPQRRTEV